MLLLCGCVAGLAFLAGVAFGTSMSLCVAGVALGDIDIAFVWKAWHLFHWAGFCDALGRPWSPVTLTSFAWRAWHSLTSMLTLCERTSTWLSCGRRGTYGFVAVGQFP